MMMMRGKGGSDTQTLQVQESSSSSEVVVVVPPPHVETVTLRLAPRREKKKVRWRADTVDNFFSCIRRNPINAVSFTRTKSVTAATKKKQKKMVPKARRSTAMKMKTIKYLL